MIIKPKNWGRSISLFYFVLHCLAQAVSFENSLEKNQAFIPGERLIYKIKWGIIPCGKVSLEIKQEINVNGDSVYHFAMTAKTNFIADRIFKVCDVFEGFCDKTMSHSLLFKKKLNEGKRKKDIVVEYDWHHSQARFSDFGSKSKIISISPNTFDPISFFYKLRTMELKKSSEYSIPVSDGEEWFQGKVRVKEGPIMKSPLGKLPTLLIEPDMESYGWIFKQVGKTQLKLWMSDDQRKIPLKFESKVTFGSFACELIFVEGIQPMKTAIPHGTKNKL